MGKSSAPDAPSPKKTAEAQTATNIGTAVAQAGLNNYNQVTPQGTATYTISGYTDWSDPLTGKKYKIPQYTLTQTLSPDQQAIYDQQVGADKNLATLGNQLSGQLKDKLTDNFSFNNDQTQGLLFDMASKRLDPQFASRENTLRQSLLNRGIREGSEAWTNEMRNFNEGRNDAYNQFALQGWGMANQQQLAEDNQRINQISALLNGGQVSQPNFLTTPQSNIANTDYAGLVQDKYRGELLDWQSKQAQQQAALGGLFGATGAGIRAFA